MLLLLSLVLLESLMSNLRKTKVFEIVRKSFVAQTITLNKIDVQFTWFIARLNFVDADFAA